MMILNTADENKDDDRNFVHHLLKNKNTPNMAQIYMIQQDEFKDKFFMEWNPFIAKKVNKRQSIYRPACRQIFRESYQMTHYC